MTDIFLVRHGETQWNHEQRYLGATDTDLSPTGQRQARELGEWARNSGATAIWTSPALRARNTATPAGQETGLEIQVAEDLMEVDFGDAEGLTPDDIEARWPGSIEAFRHDPVTNHLPGGEPPGFAATRFATTIRNIADTSAPGPVIVICHSTILRLGICELLGLPMKNYRRMFPKIGHCALTRLTVEKASASLLYFNAKLPTSDVEPTAL